MSARRFLAEVERLVRAANDEETVAELYEDPEVRRERLRAERAEHFQLLEAESREAEEVT